MAALTESQFRLLRFWGANMTIAFQTADWWPGFSYTDDEKARLAALADTVPPIAMGLWMLVFVPAIFIVFAGVAVVAILLPFVTVLYPNPADLQVLPFVVALATVAAVAIGFGLPAAMVIGGRLALKLTGDKGTVVPDAADAALYAKFRRQLWRCVLVVCGLFVPGCWLWIAFDIKPGPVADLLKYALAAIITLSGFVLWRVRR